MNRRDFLAVTSAGAAVLALPQSSQAWFGLGRRKGKLIEGRKLNIAVVGCGGRGLRHVSAAARENIVALCDVDLQKAEKNFKAFPKAKHYKDYRHMLLEMDEQIDAVMVATPDHMHFPVAMMAISMGKHVLVEKPVAHTVAEARALTLAARKHEVVTQMGNQGHAGDGTRLIREWVQGGVIGDVHEVHVWTNRPIWPQGMTQYPNPKDPPATLDWNSWLGVAPSRPYGDGFLPFKWRGWWDFGCGALGDMGCHQMDAAFWALDLNYPDRVTAEAWGATEISAPKSSIVTYEFPARNGMPPVVLKWFDGDKRPPRPKDLEANRKFNSNLGQLIFGSKGTIMDLSAYAKSPRIIPEAKMQEAAKKGLPEKTIPRIKEGDHFQEWFDACKGEGPTPGSNFDYAGPFSETVLMGNLAVRMAGKTIEWDGKNMRCTNHKEANDLVSKSYRLYDGGLDCTKTSAKVEKVWKGTKPAAKSLWPLPG